MAIQASVKYAPQLDPTVLTLQDTTNYASPDTKSNISSRTLSIFDYQNNPLPNFPNPVAFPYSGGDTISLPGMTGDLSLKVIITLVPITPNSGSVYVGEADIATNRFLQVGLFNIQVSKNNSPRISSLADAQYRQNSIDIIIEEANSQTALIYSDFTGSQLAINRGEQIIMNTQL